MRDITISEGRCYNSKKWVDRTLSFEKLCKKLQKITVTKETVEEYQHMKKADRDNVKDIGGFVGGSIEGGERKISAVKFRSLITLDVDEADIDFINNYKSKPKYLTFIYSTHSYTKEKPRLRIIIPLTRDVTPDEYIAISRLFSNEWGINQFDACSYRVNQLMFWPSTPCDGDHINELVDGVWFNPDEYLSNYPNWHDASTLPITNKEKVKFHKNGSVKEQQNPLTKSGVIGAFCRSYSITSAIETFLSDVYEPTQMENRYTYAKGESSGGLIVYNDLFAYSHHATDPACGVCANAFDLVRIHRYQNLNEKESLDAMMKFAVEDINVKTDLLNQRMKNAADDFEEIDVQEDDSWKHKLLYSEKTGQLLNRTENLELILKHESFFKNVAYNDFVNQVEILGNVPWKRAVGNPFWLDSDTNQLKSILDKYYLAFSSRNHDVTFDKVVHDRHFHPVRDYLNSLQEWDGVPRVDDLFIKYFQAEDTPYIRAVTRKVFTAAVARIYEPGIKFDSIPVLDGEQGIGKSSMIKYLTGSQFFSDSLTLTDMNDKTGAEKLQGFWIIEIGELAGMRKADIEKVKSFISCTDDKYRASYGKVVQNHPRQCVIFATVNGERGYLRDVTGNRRFWVIKLNQREQKWTWKEDPYFRDQFWAECIYHYKQGEKLYLEGDILEASRVEQKKAMEVDERLGLVQEYLSKLLPTNWDSMDLYARRNFLDGDIICEKGTMLRTRVSNAEIWCECFRKNISEIKPSDSYAIAALMMQIDGWKRMSNSIRIPIYGKQRLYCMD